MFLRRHLVGGLGWMRQGGMSGARLLRFLAAALPFGGDTGPIGWVIGLGWTRSCGGIWWVGLGG